MSGILTRGVLPLRMTTVGCSFTILIRHHKHKQETKHNANK